MNISKIVHNPNYSIFVLGFVCFYNIIFFTKYFEYIYHPNYTLLTLVLIQFVGLLSIRFFSFFSKINIFLPGIHFTALIALSNSDLGTPFWVPAVSATVVTLVLQYYTFFCFKNSQTQISKIFLLEFIGAILGLLVYQIGSVLLGFNGFLGVNIFVCCWLIFSSVKLQKSVPLALGLIIFSILFSQQPQPIIDKKNRSVYLQNGEVIDHGWDPDGHVEQIHIRSDNTVLVNFEGGLFSSHVVTTPLEFATAREHFDRSHAVGIFGLDVIAAHYLSSQNNKVVALISCIGGQEIVAAKAYGATEIYAVDINQTALKMASIHSTKTTSVFENVNQIPQDGRYFIKKAEKKFDVIQIYSATLGGLASAVGTILQPTTLFTSEALHDYSQKLTPNGILQLTTAGILKLQTTFNDAFGENFFTRSKKVIVFKRSGDFDDLITVLYKNSEWSQQEIAKLETWLMADKENQWVILVDPRIAAENQKINALAQQAENFYPRPSTDNWPFFKLVTNPIKHSIQFKILILTLIFILILFLVALQKSVAADVSIVKEGFLLGTVYAMAQSILIIILQKHFSRPSWGLTAALIAVLFTSSCAVLFLKKQYKINALISAGLPALTIFAPITLLGLCFVQTLRFLKLINQNPLYLAKIFWNNGLGLIFGMALFNVIFVGFGFVQVVVAYSAINAYLLLKKES